MSSIYMELSDPLFDVVTEDVYKSYPNACICWIEIVQNEHLEEAFKKRKGMMAKERGREPEVRKLYHGTKTGIVSKIVSEGFRPDLNKVSAYGKGTYFAVNPKLSLGYTDKCRDSQMSFVFQCEVLIGNTTLGTSNKVMDTSLYDNFVNNTTNPAIIVTPYADAALPKYVIAFYKNPQI